MLSARRGKIIRTVAKWSPLALALVAGLLATPVFASICPIVGTCG